MGGLREEDKEEKRWSPINYHHTELKIRSMMQTHLTHFYHWKRSFFFAVVTVPFSLFDYLSIQLEISVLCKQWLRMKMKIKIKRLYKNQQINKSHLNSICIEPVWKQWSLKRFRFLPIIKRNVYWAAENYIHTYTDISTHAPMPSHFRTSFLPLFMFPKRKKKPPTKRTTMYCEWPYSYEYEVHATILH